MKYEFTNVTVGTPSPNRKSRRAQAARERSAKTPYHNATEKQPDTSAKQRPPEPAEHPSLGRIENTEIVRGEGGWFLVSPEGAVALAPRIMRLFWVSSSLFPPES